MPKFKTTLMQAEGMNATGIEVPAKIVEGFGQGKRPKVVLTVKGHTYRSTIAVMGGKYMIGVPKEHREAASVKGGDKIEVTLELDTAPREVDVPKDLAAALKKAKMTEAFDKLSFTHRKEHVRAINEAKAAETRARRIDKCVEMLKAGKRAGV
ncbi:MAG TPA: YdeI/OmpD-associated family protein [Hyphomonadaceae bacterium]|nr:YdeI/OmpD-associated family protein [Hyphomonadaceae bacterium]